MFFLNKNKKLAWTILIFLSCLNILAWFIVFDLNKKQPLEVVFFDVGQGDAIFVETPQRHQILIDGGPSSTILEKLAKEMPFYDRSIDLVILTHPEKDHLFGLLEVLKRYKIENILWTGIIRETAEWQKWKELINQEKAGVRIAKGKERVIIDEDPLIYLYILNPLKNLEGQKFKDSNDTSIVAKLVFGKDSFLFTGDITKKIEERLVEENADLDSDVLKVAHHGSKTSSSPSFLEQVSPELAVIQVGKNNRYGHPHPEVLARLKQFAIQILRTDIAGDIKIVSDGVNLLTK